MLKNNIISRKCSLFIQNSNWVNLVWFLIPLIAALLKVIHGTYNNHLIYKGVYYHTILQTNLYNLYPAEFFDKNHYGIVFCLIIAPFVFLPDVVAILLIQLIQLWGLHFAIRKLPIDKIKQNMLFIFLLFEAIANCQNVQFNTFIAFVLVAAYVWIINQSEFKAAFIIMLGFFVKLYGIVGLGLFFFVKHKPNFIIYILLSAVLLFFAPLLITNFKFIMISYNDWFIELQSKNDTNSSLDNLHQNMSAIGMFMKIFKHNSFNLLFIVVPAFLFQLIPIIRISLFQNKIFQMHYLASLLMFIILFNTATETSTFIIGTTGAGIWWLNQKRFNSPSMIAFMLFVFFLGTLSTTDLVPKYFNIEIVRKYSLKAFPYLIVWCLCIYQLVFSKFSIETKGV